MAVDDRQTRGRHGDGTGADGATAGAHTRLGVLRTAIANARAGTLVLAKPETPLAGLPADDDPPVGAPSIVPEAVMATGGLHPPAPDHAVSRQDPALPVVEAPPVAAAKPARRWPFARARVPDLPVAPAPDVPATPAPKQPDEPGSNRAVDLRHAISGQAQPAEPVVEPAPEKKRRWSRPRKPAVPAADIRNEAKDGPTAPAPEPARRWPFGPARTSGAAVATAPGAAPVSPPRPTPAGDAYHADGVFSRFLGGAIAGTAGDRRDDAAPDTAPQKPAADGLTEPKAPTVVYVASLAINILGLGLPLVILQVYDRILPNQAAATLAILVMAMCVVILLDVSLKSVRAHVMAHVGARFAERTTRAAMRRIMRAPHGAVEAEPASAHMARLTAVQGIADYHAGPSRVAMIDLPFAGIFLMIMALVGGLLALIPVVLFAMFALLTIRRNRVLRQVMTERAEQDTRRYDFIIEALSGIHTIKALAMESAMQRRFERLQQAVSETTHRSILVSSETQAANATYGNISQVAVVAIGALLVIDGDLTMGALACCTLLSGQVLQPLMKSIAVMQEQESLSVKRADAAELFDLPRTPEPKTAPTGAILQRIEVSGAGYVLPDGAARLAGLDLVIGFGDFIGIRAEDAAMRTPLTRLIRGDLLPSAGSVRFDGLDGSDPESLPLRRQIAYVGPTPAVLRGTILENLTLFRGSAWRDVARRAAALVGVEDDIHLLPDGYDTRIGEGAVDDFPASFLQQIALARAIASGPAVLLLDEVNTPLDRKAEASLIRALDALRGHVTIVLLTLRPSLLAVADRHWLLRDGHLIETPKPTSTPAVSRTGAE